MVTIGIDVGGTNLKAGVVDESGRILHSKKIPLGPWQGGEMFTERLRTLAETAAEEAGFQKSDIAWVGMGFPGAVDDETGVLTYITNIPLSGFPVREYFQRQWDVPVYLGNDANCAALGEYHAGAGRGCRSLVVVTLGTGVGGGVVLDGKLLTGFNGTGGEVGHMVIVPGGERCNCGRIGCWERYASATALRRLTVEAMERHPESLMWQLTGGDSAKAEGYTPFDAARQGDAAAREVCEKYIDYVALGAANLINIFQPEMLALGGGVSAQEDLLEPVRRRIAQEDFARNAGLPRTRVERCALGNDAGVIGAAMLGKQGLKR
ncbi:MAG: ROK family protein [Oscillospiraceae bacterium]